VIVYVVLGVLATAVSLAAVANSRWAGTRGWVYNKHNPRPSGIGIPSAAFGQILQPSIVHVIEEQSSERLRGHQDETGEDGPG
jgi:hypothetical protein